jgi:integrase
VLEPVQALAAPTSRPLPTGIPPRANRPRIPQAPLWLAILGIGARFAEITSATWADFDPEARTLTLKAAMTKNRMHAVLPVVPELVADLGLDDASSELERLSSFALGAGAKVAPREDAQNDAQAQAS